MSDITWCKNRSYNINHHKVHVTIQHMTNGLHRLTLHELYKEQTWHDQQHTTTWTTQHALHELHSCMT